MFKNTVPFAFLLCLTSLAQQSQNKTQPKSAGSQEVIDLTHPSATASIDSHKLSKDYRKSAITAKSSIDDWNKRALEVSSSIHFSGDLENPVTVARSSAEREADSAERAKKDVKLAKVDVTTPADSFLQKKLEAYLEEATQLNYEFTHPVAGRKRPDEEIRAVASCNVSIGKALDEGSTIYFEEHPETKCE